MYNQLNDHLLTYLQPDDCEGVFQAYQLAQKAHCDQFRYSGEPYIIHPIEVARILAHFYLDKETIQAALLHDVLEDSSITKHEIKTLFGEKVAELVDGVSKLKQIKFPTRAHEQAENMRKMMFAVAQDIRVLLIKLADRLHNMRTIDAVPAHKRKRKAVETLEIYAPIAYRLGMNGLKKEFEDLGFKALFPWRYQVFLTAVEKNQLQRRDLLQHLFEKVKQTLSNHGVKIYQMKTRQKNIFSIYRKMQKKHCSFHEVLDLIGIRVVLYSMQDCYRVLGLLHNLYKPLLGKFKDYIAIPKANGYQSLHTTLLSAHGIPIEFQIRTLQMDLIAENGIASHWIYKSDSPLIDSSHMRVHQWIKTVIEIQKTSKNPLEFVENMKIDLHPGEVYVFDDKGEIWTLPKNSTPIDLAYAKAIQEGNHIVACKIDRRIAALSTPLQSGQTVELIISEQECVNPNWLTFAVTGKARAHIRHWLRNQQHQHSLHLGRKLISKELKTYNVIFDDILTIFNEDVLKEFQVDSFDELVSEVGFGRQTAAMVAQKLCQIQPGATSSQQRLPLSIHGTEGLVLQYCISCFPIPGDKIIGFMKENYGIVIHRDLCDHVDRMNESELISLVWDPDEHASFNVKIVITVVDHLGILALLASEIAKHKSNIVSVIVPPAKCQIKDIIFVLMVKNRVHLARLIKKIRGFSFVQRIKRA